MVNVTEITPGNGRSVLIVIAHADDLSLFIGGTVACWSAADWRVIVARVTDDRWDSVDLGEAETITRNRIEFERAAEVLGVAEIIDFGYHTDMLGDASEVELRERIIRLVRTYKPFALVTFDPYAMFGEDNQDHKLVATATDEAFWTSQFGLHHPEHLAHGLSLHGCFERWYFGRRVIQVTDVIDITSVLGRKVDAAVCHSTMLANIAHQLKLQAATGGWELPVAEEAMSSGNFRPLAEAMLRARSASGNGGAGPAVTEEFRVVRFGGMQPLLDVAGRRIDPAH